MSEMIFCLIISIIAESIDMTKLCDLSIKYNELFDDNYSLEICIYQNK
jgi:hypothetical protein